VAGFGETRHIAILGEIRPIPSKWKIRRLRSGRFGDFTGGKMGDFNLEKWEISTWENGKFV